MDIPRDKKFPTDSVQCNGCGGFGCQICDNKGWLAPGTHSNGRHCERRGCNKPIPPSQVAIYCSDACAFDDA